ncbi:CBS domain-containing protein [Natronorubrum sp. JWXQ-INN-674]|uniref:Zinc metalloprotease n=1 Tax=Natronorubrum halalkaliphilum TaxID=2691917 RepID=A0A6B0VQA3_9EURY|nr:site-2 protease family protein [Natronorubrum halalkaliphilum]MXV62659.1 CBS domain-containing protein [Natronorubrum halalkaliphilum]
MNYTVLRVWGIPIRLNISLFVFLPILAWLIGSGEQLAAYATLINSMTPATVEAAQLTDADRWIIGTAAAIGLFASVTLHELGHAWAAMRYDIEVESITLWILGGLASLTEMPKEWNREFWIAVAGPVTSLLVGAVCLAALFVVPESATLVVFALGLLAVMNVVLAIFNMLPAFPMDGGRVLRAVLARNRSYVSATRTAARAGIAFAIVFIFLGVVVAFSPVLVLVALFIYIGATTESRTVVIAELLSGFSVSDLVSQSETVPADATAETILARLLSARRTNLAVVDKSGTVVGAITASALRDIRPAEYETTTVGEIATTDLPRIDGETSAFDALQELRSGRSEAVLVERDGVPIGLVSQEDFTAVLNFRRDTVAF